MGIFDRSTAGFETAPIRVPVERGAIAFFAETIGETNPIHFDLNAARAAGHSDVVAPPTYPVVLEMAAAKLGQQAGQTPPIEVIAADMRYLLHGTESYSYNAPIRAGDEVEVVTRIKGFSDAKGGALEIAHLETEIRSTQQVILAVAHRELIHRLPEGARS